MHKKAPGVLLFTRDSGSQAQLRAPVLSAKCFLLGAEVPKTSLMAKNAQGGLGLKTDAAACPVQVTYLEGSI